MCSSIEAWRVYASVLSADPLAVGRDIDRVLPYVDGLHWDIMDGHYVPNLTIGPALMRRARTQFPEAYFDVHVMADPGQDIIPLFWDLGIQSLSFHPKTVPSVEVCLDELHRRGVQAGFAVNLEDTPLTWPPSWWDKVDYVVVMAVKPGFPAQTFTDSALEQVRAMRNRFPHLSIIVDGGINQETAQACRTSGASGVISGNFIFEGGAYQARTQALRL